MLGSLGLMVLRRLALGVPLILAIVVLTFTLTRLAPGDPALLLAGDAPTPEFLEKVRIEYDLDKPVTQQLVTYLFRAVQGNLGTSIYFGVPVTQLILQHFPVTLLLTCLAMFSASVLGILLGVVAADRRDTATDAIVGGASLIGFSIPTDTRKSVPPAGSWQRGVSTIARTPSGSARYAIFASTRSLTASPSGHSRRAGA